MNYACERIRERIEDSIGRALGGDEQSTLDLHCAGCESCREYRERLVDDHSRLDAFAALHSTSELRAEKRVIAAIPAEAPVLARRRGIQRAFPKVPGVARIALAAAIVIAVIVGIDFLRDVRNGPVPAFASVIERMEKAENLVFRDREWSLGKWRTIERGFSQSGSRIQWADSTYISHRREADTTQDCRYETQLVLHPATKRAVVRTFEFVQPRVTLRRLNSEASSPEEKARYRRLRTSMEQSSVERIASWQKREGFSFLRTERREGKNAAVYVSGTGTGRHHKWTTWVDLDTGLPFRIEIVRPNPMRYGLQLSDFLPTGAPRSSVAGWTDLGPGEPASIYDDFRWNTELDTSYFSVTPPAGYSVTRIELPSKEESADWEKRWREGVPFEAGELAKTLSIWASLSGGVFPDDIRDLGDSIKVRPLVIARHNKEGVAGDELRAAIHDASQFKSGFGYVSRYVEDGRLHYFGKGVSLGDSTRIVCWGEETGWGLQWRDNPYWIIYADLHCVPSMTPPKVPGK
jgi:hypothetical protein